MNLPVSSIWGCYGLFVLEEVALVSMLCVVAMRLFSYWAIILYHCLPSCLCGVFSQDEWWFLTLTYLLYLLVLTNPDTQAWMSGVCVFVWIESFCSPTLASWPFSCGSLWLTDQVFSWRFWVCFSRGVAWSYPSLRSPRSVSLCRKSFFPSFLKTPRTQRRG